MKKHFALILIPVALVVFALAFSFLFAAAPVHASGQAVGTFLQTTPLPTISVNVTAVVPNTGNPPQRTTIFFSSWLVWLVLGIAVIVLLAALIGRGRPTTEIHEHIEHHDHFD